MIYAITEKKGRYDALSRKKDITYAITEKTQKACAIMEKRQIIYTITTKRHITCAIMEKITDDTSYHGCLITVKRQITSATWKIER